MNVERIRNHVNTRQRDAATEGHARQEREGENRRQGGGRDINC